MRTFHYSALAATISVILTVGCQSGPPKREEPFLFFPLPPAEPRIQYLTWASGANQVVEEKSSFEKLVLGEEEIPAGTIVKPYGLAARDGVLYVCDTKGYNLTRLDFKNKTYAVLGRQGPGRLRKPLNVVVDPLGFKFVADSFRKQIVVFGPDDEYATAFDIAEPCHPVDVACYGNEIYVLDNDKTPQIVVLDRTSGKVLRSFGSFGEEEGQFHVPNSLCIDPDGFLYVSDTLNFRIQKLTRDGEVVWVRGNPGYRLGQFGRPRGIRTGPDGIVYLVEGAMQLVQMFDSDGQVLMRFGGPGNAPGSMVLPSTLTVDDTSIPYFEKYIHEDFDVEYLLFVANQYGERLINVYAFGSFPEGYKFGESGLTTLPPVEGEKSIGPVEHMEEGAVPVDGKEGPGGEQEKNEQEEPEKKTVPTEGPQAGKQK